MDIETILNQEAETLAKEEEAARARLTEWRKVNKAAPKANWLENLPLVASTTEERKHWASTIEKDVVEQRSIKRVNVSANYTQGPKKSPALVLAKLIVQAAQVSKVQIPKTVLMDLEKSNLPARYAQLLESEEA